jgi:nicotinate-nucleotide pyrophosphorylase (carboxylating)
VVADFRQIEWDLQTADDCRQIVRLAVREDLGRGVDLTTAALVPFEARGSARLMVRQQGIIAGLPAIPLLIEEMQLDAVAVLQVSDGSEVRAGTCVAVLDGSARDLLTAERIMLNLLSRLSGVATLTRRYVSAIADTPARVYDTRKTTPGWRRLEKYAVRCGGGHNHRTGLFDAVLIKDNHLAQRSTASDSDRNLSGALTQAREFVGQFLPEPVARSTPIEIEVDSLEQLAEVLPMAPDLVLLDNMSIDQLKVAAEMTRKSQAKIQLEASGGITLENIREVATTGVDRISVGALTHSATALDLALDWNLPKGT